MWSRRIGDPRGSQRVRRDRCHPGTSGPPWGGGGPCRSVREGSVEPRWVGRTGITGRSGRASGTERFLTLPRPPRARVVGDASEQLTTDERGEARGRSAMWRRISAEIPRIAGEAARMARKDQLRMARRGDPRWPGRAGLDRREVARSGRWCDPCDICAGWCAAGTPGVRPGSAPADPPGNPGPRRRAGAARNASEPGHCYPGIPWTGGIKRPGPAEPTTPRALCPAPPPSRRDGAPRASHHVTFDSRPTGAPSWHSPIPARHRTAAP